MSASLVGSEMCIRDRLSPEARPAVCRGLTDSKRAMDEAMSSFARLYFTQDIKYIKKTTKPASLESQCGELKT
eukprot:10052669-Alexandrium_andersonii.AAC.1